MPRLSDRRPNKSAVLPVHVKSENKFILFDEHWQFKKKMAKGITNPDFDRIYELAKENGALGGKISGAGGGGFFTFYCEEKQDQLRSAMQKTGLMEMQYDIDFEGTKTLANFMDYRSTDIYNS